MRWMPLEVFTAGEPNPYPPGVAVLRRLRAVPRDPHPGRSWLLPSFNGVRVWRSFSDRYTDSVIGHAWIRRSTLRWRRIAWTLWLVGLAALIVVTTVYGAGDPDAASRCGGLLVALALVALVLIAGRVKAVIDPDDGDVGVQEWPAP